MKRGDALISRVPQGIRVVSWDVDGTLYPLGSFKRKLVWMLVRRIPRLGFAHFWSTLRDIQKLHDWIDRQRAEGGARVDRAGWEQRNDVFMREKALFAEILPKLKLRRGVRELLDHFRATGVIQVTLSDLEAAYKVEALGVRDYFVAHFPAESLGFWKPSAVPFQQIEQQYGIQPHEHLHIGDRAISDGAGSVAAGCHFLHLP